MVFREVLAYEALHGRLPQRNGPDDALTLRWQRARKGKLTENAQDLKRQVDARVERSAAAAQNDSRAAREEQALRMRQQHWREDNSETVTWTEEDHWRWPALQRSRGGQHPCPSLSNLCNTCYLNAPLQCLLHCPAARAALLGAEGEGEQLVEDGEGEIPFERSLSLSPVGAAAPPKPQ